MLLFSRRGELDFGKMAVQVACHRVPQRLTDGCENRAVAVRVREQSAADPGIHVSEVDHRYKAAVNAALTDDFFQGAELIDLAHGFDAEPDAGAVCFVAQHVNHACEGVAGERHCLLPGDLSCTAAVDDDGICTEQFRCPQGFADIFHAFLPFFFLNAGQGDEVGGMQGHENPVFARFLPDLAQGVLRGVYPLSRFVFVGIQALFFQPGRHLQGAFSAFREKPFTVAARSEGCFPFHTLTSFPFLICGCFPDGCAGSDG